MKEKLFKAIAEAMEMEPSQIRENDILRDYENYSSLSELSILALLDSEFGIEIEMKEFNNLIKVGDLLELVNKTRS